MVTEKKETAVEWLGWELNTELFYDIDEGVWNRVKEIFEQALQMEREQIIKANRDGADMIIDRTPFITGKEYYEQTYGGQDE